jgi:hypothetical protein
MEIIMEDVIFNPEKIEDIQESGGITPLDDIYEIENVALKIKSLSKKVEFYKDYKKKKTSDIKDAIDKIENRVKFLKKVILKTLEENNEKSLSFPGTCKVSSRNTKGKWIITDEEVFMEALKEEGEFDKIVEKHEEFKIVKKEANKLLDTWKKNGKIEETSEYIEKEDDCTSVQITYEKEDDSTYDDAGEDVPVKNDYDALSF